MKIHLTQRPKCIQSDWKLIFPQWYILFYSDTSGSFCFADASGYKIRVYHHWFSRPRTGGSTKNGGSFTTIVCNLVYLSYNDHCFGNYKISVRKIRFSSRKSRETFHFINVPCSSDCNRREPFPRSISQVDMNCKKFLCTHPSESLDVVREYLQVLFIMSEDQYLSVSFNACYTYIISSLVTIL